MRYFFASFLIRSGKFAIEGDATFQLDKFPSKMAIQALAACEVNQQGYDVQYEHVTILNLFEFQSKQDYEDFREGASE